MISRDVVIKGWRRDCVTKRNKFFHVTAMVVEPLNAAIQIHQWWEQNPSSLLIMVKSQQLVVVTLPDLWSLIQRPIKSKIVRKTFVVSEG
ncbi:hypothetical protein IGI04_018605 [Brassica rapa subsp. trilocularis]|uniref:Uncharacterized protein n=1 Tax=Brassica rapa subsp. trilocularis TaxID=1813537 RepID=A0ABQ7MFW1_BRACM|nr:hypothetical protein IGI04_018605 [Brassica rapa subsp. trilocularis]